MLLIVSCRIFVLDKTTICSDLMVTKKGVRGFKNLNYFFLDLFPTDVCSYGGNDCTHLHRETSTSQTNQGSLVFCYFVLCILTASKLYSKERQYSVTAV